MPAKRTCRCGKTFVVTPQYPHQVCCSKNCRERKYRAEAKSQRRGNAKRTLVDGPCPYCQPMYGHASRVRNGEICRACLAIQNLHDAAQIGDETAATEYIYRRAAEIRSENKHPQGYAQAPAEVPEYSI